MLREGEVRIPSGCAIAALVNRRGHVFAGTMIADCIAMMRDRSNGLGGGFAAYGIYPDMKEEYALHVFFDGTHERRNFEALLRRQFQVVGTGPIPTRSNDAIKSPPVIWRYFVTPIGEADREQFISDFIIRVNAEADGAYIISFGQNMGVFKGVGYPEDIADFYRLDEYRGHIWTAHGRFPTNTPGWWGGAHPFALMETTVVHNGEISSYDANRRFIEMFGYRCSLQTDTEVIAYTFDFLCRRQGMTLEEAAQVVAPPLWEEIALMDPESAGRFTRNRSLYGPLLLNGPFSIVLATSQGIMALNDRLKLRPMVAAETGDYLAVASEESALRRLFPSPDRIWSPRGGEPVMGRVERAMFNSGSTMTEGRGDQSGCESAPAQVSY